MNHFALLIIYLPFLTLLVGITAIITTVVVQLIVIQRLKDYVVEELQEQLKK